MLDLRKVAGQMSALSEQVQGESLRQKLRLERANQLLQMAIEHQSHYENLQIQWGKNFVFNCAQPCAPLAENDLSFIYDEPHQVIAADGSQIAPSRHEAVYCYLVNVGRVWITYGTGQRPLLDSVPEVYYQPEDLYRGRQWGITTEEWMKWQRSINEIKGLAELAMVCDRALPTLALVDGSLVYWELENLPTPARHEILQPILAVWEQLRSLGIPLIGYISSPRATETTNFLRLLCCAYDTPNCTNHCGDRLTENLPCGQVYPLRDSTLWQSRLQVGEFSPLWRSTADISAEYGQEQEIYFSYVNLGSEVARVDMPAWTACDQTLRELAYSIILAQVQKGYGYPVALAESHNQAVVTNADRHRFFSILQSYLQRAGVSAPNLTNKETRKRRSIA